MASKRLSLLHAHICGASDPEPEIIAGVAGAIASLKLNNPKAMNALTVNMCEQLLSNIKRWHVDPSVSFILLTADGKAFSAGGDVKSSILDIRNGGTMYEHQFATEYTLMHWVAKCSKPQISLINGATLGCGAGLVTHGRFRVVTEKASLAMPETGIGIFPDVGMSFVLPRLRNRLGVFAGLSSYRFNAKELISTGLATHFVPSEVLADLEAALRREADSATIGEGKLASIIGRFSCDPPVDMRCPLLEHEAAIDRCFKFDTITDIVHALRHESAKSDSSESAWAADTLKILQQKSPTSLHITLRAMQLNLRPGASLDEALKFDYRMIVACARRSPHSDFNEGVRAVLIDKTGDPRWNPATVEEVTPESVLAHFEGLGDKELSF